MVPVSGMMANMSNGNGANSGGGSRARGTETGQRVPGPGSAGAADGAGAPGAPGARRLERKINGRLLAGVCAGLSDYFNLDVTLIRVIFAVLVFFAGFGPLAYILAWALIPEEGEPVSIAEKLINKTSS
jgi:phage shock protein PspC (stress-responsive transcriptional regulator)